MKNKHVAQLCALILPCALLLTAPAYSYCGVIQETAQAKNAARAARKAESQLRHKVKILKRENGKKLALDKKSSACVGGAISIDASGKEVVGFPSCTVTQPFCVNP